MSKGDKIINWTPEMFNRFKVAHKAAVAAKRKSFIFDGNEFIISYAAYLIEYLNTIFPDA